MDNSVGPPNTTRTLKRRLSSASSPSYYIANSPSIRLANHSRKRQNTSTQSHHQQHHQPVSLSHNITSLYSRLTTEQPPNKVTSRSQRKHFERRPHTSRYLSPTVSSLQRQSSISDPDTLGQASSTVYDTSSSSIPRHRDRQADSQAPTSLLDHQQGMKNGSLMGLYGRYLQWEWLALKMEKTINHRKRVITDQLLAVKDIYKQLDHHVNDKIQDWMENYLEDVEKDLSLMESGNFTMETKESCLSKLYVAKSELNKLMDQVKKI
ncbi:hypothetical protein BC941DRAFT_433678 [Chlamydoabsidia padenii]|nr:hypothetical protein BC941DRAFT_433678 [Chlamydoabsidia padenii]